MTNGEHINDDAERQRLNEAAGDFARAQARIAREKLISFAYEAVKVFTAEDHEASERLEGKELPEGESVGIYILENVNIAPAREEHIPVTRTLLLAPNTEIGQTGDDRLRLFVPIDEAAEEGKELENTPREIYVEIVSHEGEVTRYAVNNEEVYEYISAADTGEQIIKDDLHEEVWQRRASLRIDTGMSIVSQIQENFINMRAVPQRIITVGQGRPLEY